MVYDSEKEKYQAYLCSREWGLLRDRVRIRCGGICERCKHNAMSHVHHLTYIRKYDERLEDLQGLCEGCHLFVHGRSGKDPLLAAPVRWKNREIKSVYLAGRISGKHGAWRSEIVPKWSIYMGDDDVAGGSDESWDNHRTCLAKLPDGRSIKYAGPFWKELEGGHGGGYGPHAMGEVPEDNHGMRVHSELEDPHGLIINIYHAITGCDMVFAWLDSREAWGTIWELGFAWQRCPIAVAVPKFDRELWLACRSANWFTVAESAGEAWKMLWSGKGKTDFSVLDKNENYGTYEGNSDPSDGWPPPELKGIVNVSIPGRDDLPPLELARVHQVWEELVKKVGINLGVRLSQASPIGVEEPDVLVIGPRSGYNRMVDSCGTDEALKKIGHCLQRLLRRPVTVRYQRMVQ